MRSSASDRRRVTVRLLAGPPVRPDAGTVTSARSNGFSTVCHWQHLKKWRENRGGDHDVSTLSTGFDTPTIEWRVDDGCEGKTATVDVMRSDVVRFPNGRDRKSGGRTGKSAGPCADRALVGRAARPAALSAVRRGRDVPVWRSPGRERLRGLRSTWGTCVRLFACSRPSPS